MGHVCKRHEWRFFAELSKIGRIPVARGCEWPSFARVGSVQNEYRAPWLYGVAALTNLARVGKQEHWFSDTVAGSVLGYGLGRLFWESARGNTAVPQVFVEPNKVNFSWTFF